MPTYDYRCNTCKHEFEHFQSMKDAPLKKCPKCGKARLERLIGIGAAVLFKGSGFYQTDYRSDAYAKSAKADAAASNPKAAESGGSSGVGESKASPDSKSSDGAKSPTESKVSKEAKPSGESKPSGETKPSASSTPEPPKPRAPAKSKKRD